MQYVKNYLQKITNYSKLHLKIIQKKLGTANQKSGSKVVNKNVFLNLYSNRNVKML